MVLGLAVFKRVHHRLFQPHSFQMCLAEVSLQNVKNDGTKILRRRYGIGKFRLHIQIFQVEFGYNVLMDTLVQFDEAADHAIFIDLAANCNFEDVVVPMPVRVIALAVNRPALRLRHLIAVQAVRGGEAVPAIEIGFHLP